MQQRVVAALRIGEKVDEGGHVVVHHQRKIGLGGGQIGFGLGHKVGVHIEGHIAGHLGRRGFLLGHKAVALLQRFRLKSVHSVHDAVELFLQLGIASDVDVAGQHQVHGEIEFILGLRQSSLVIVGFALGVSLLHLRDQQARLLLLTRKPRRGGRGCLRR